MLEINPDQSLLSTESNLIKSYKNKQMEKQNNWLAYKIEIRERLKEFSLQILELSKNLETKDTRSKVINYQLTKSGTSTYANYRAALRGRSKAEFYSKLCISIEEMDESEMWIDMLIEANIYNDSLIKELHTESVELLKMLASMRKKLN